MAWKHFIKWFDESDEQSFLVNKWLTVSQTIIALCVTGVVSPRRLEHTVLLYT